MVSNSCLMVSNCWLNKGTMNQECSSFSKKYCTKSSFQLLNSQLLKKMQSSPTCLLNAVDLSTLPRPWIECKSGTLWIADHLTSVFFVVSFESFSAVEISVSKCKVSALISGRDARRVATLLACNGRSSYDFRGADLFPSVPTARQIGGQLARGARSACNIGRGPARESNTRKISPCQRGQLEKNTSVSSLAKQLPTSVLASMYTFLILSLCICRSTYVLMHGLTIPGNRCKTNVLLNHPIGWNTTKPL